MKLEGGHAALSPLRFHYDTDKLELPVKLGLINSSGTQDLIVYVLGRDRYEVANFSNVTVPTNLDVSKNARGEFGTFYASLYDRTLERHPGAVVTEYAWQASSCDPCPGDTSGLSAPDIASLGADVMSTLTVRRGGGAPSIRQGATQVTPGLPPEVIQRIVRQSFGRFRLCYENGLATNPTLNGRISVKFDIGPDGSVTSAQDASSEFPDKNVVACVVRGFHGLSFPQPETKKVTVTYPIIFGAPASSSASTPAVMNTPLVVTRLHARYGKGALGQDLVFRVAEPITGGREVMRDGKLEHGALPATGTSSFQARYAIRHPWTGPLACKEPRRGIWGGPWPDAGARAETTTATKLGLQTQRNADLAAFTSITGAQLGATVLDAKPQLDGGAVPTTDAGPAEPKPAPPSRCGCRAVGEDASTNPFAALLLGMIAAAGRRSLRRSATPREE